MVEHVNRFKTGKDAFEVRRREIEQFLLEHTTIGECVKVALAEKGSLRRWERIYGFIGAGLCLLRGGREQALLSLHQKEDLSVLPIDPNQYEVVKDKKGRGYWSDVWLAEPIKEGLPRIVIKVEYPVKQRPLEELEREMGQLRDEYEFLRREFAAKGLKDLIPDTRYLITMHPRTRVLAIAQIQVYAGDDPIDLRDPKNKVRIQELLATDSLFRNDFNIFREETLRLWQENRQEPDIAGFGNVLILKQGDRHVIKLVDPHRIHPDNMVAQRDQAEAIEHLRGL